MELFEVSSHRWVVDPSLFESNDPDEWENAYQETMREKYLKGTRNFSRKITGKPYEGKGGPPIFLIPRTRGGPSYKSIEVEGVDKADLMYALVSKGYPMQDLSSFTIGPIVGEGLCLVNAAFSKAICLKHIEGGGKVDFRRKNFWKPSRYPERTIELGETDGEMIVDGEQVQIMEWLRENEDLWLDEWEKWRQAVALCSEGNFHWADDSPTIAYRHRDEYLDFVQWKKECYIRPSYELLPTISAFQFLQEMREKHHRPLGLVHPMARKARAEEPITRETLRVLFDSPEVMACQPYVVAGKLLNVEI